MSCASRAAIRSSVYAAVEFIPALLKQRERSTGTSVPSTSLARKNSNSNAAWARSPCAAASLITRDRNVRGQVADGLLSRLISDENIAPVRGAYGRMTKEL